ncbi:MAG: HEAT repeat domain-containing protein [bacterium]|nr:HEAT repeat domain-containing protein [bacterium]
MTKKRTKSMTAQEFLDQKQNDPEYQAMLKKKEEEFAARGRELDEMYEPILKDIRKAGYRINDIDDILSETGQAMGLVPVSSEIVNIILAKLPQLSDIGALDWLVRIVGATRTPYKADALIELFDKTESVDLKWIIGNTFSLTEPENIYPWIMEKVRDKSLGPARQMLVVALGGIKDNREVIDLLLNVLDDPEIGGFAVEPLGRLGAVEAREKIEACLEHKEKWVRRDAKKALKVL